MGHEQIKALLSLEINPQGARYIKINPPLGINSIHGDILLDCLLPTNRAYTFKYKESNQGGMEGWPDNPNEGPLLDREWATDVLIQDEPDPEDMAKILYNLIDHIGVA